MNTLQQLLEQNPSGWVKVGWLWTGEAELPAARQYLHIANGLLTEITATRPHQFIDLSPAFLIPPLVNAHCHLEFSQLTEPLPQLPNFADWITETVKLRRQNESLPEAIQHGLTELAGCGTGYVAEIQTQPLTSYPASFPLAGYFFREVIAFEEDQLANQLEQVQTDGQRFPFSGGTGWRQGLSPHAPYTVCPEFLERCIGQASRWQLPVTMHLAETEAERELVEHQRGELVEMLRRLSLWRPDRYPSGTRLQDYLELLDQSHRVLIAHGNYFQRAEITAIASCPQMSVVYCPRTHAYFGHAAHPWQEMIDQGIPVVLGTDGRGSNPDLNLWHEVQFLAAKYPQHNPLTFLPMATTAAARALLGIDTKIHPGSNSGWNFLFPADRSDPFFEWKDYFYQPVRSQFVMLRE